jgi:RHH-type proline utilization regulon transcriptional repressor/proline dehydrogenase/delta 1-pyrroline-5-carboxylate dehydrogenase
MIFEKPLPGRSLLRQTIDRSYRTDEAAAVRALLSELDLAPESRRRIDDLARRLVASVRANRVGKGGIDAFLHEYGLSTQEGVMLMCIAEALLRIPDDETQERLIRDKISAADWERHLGHSESLFVNASTWALMLTGRVVRLHDFRGQSAGALVRRLVARFGEPVIREAVNQAMRILGRQFVMGRTIGEALERAKTLEKRGYRYSYDMLGEAARTMKDAERYFESYRHAIEAIGRAAAGKGVVEGAGISVKLSALHPRYEVAQERRVMDELAPRLAALARAAAKAGIGLNIDAEEADRLDPSLDVIEAVSADPELAGWEGFGVVVQAYQKRAPFVLDWLADLAARHRRRFMVRLVKGAYWDTEIKRAQEKGLDGYPLFTRKVSTDVSYLACARRLFGYGGTRVYPQFATHNAHTIAAVLEFAGNRRDFEFQRLHGMGEALYEQVVEKDQAGVACRIYAPVGQHEDLLAYLVRRLLENGANTSFVNRIQDEKLPIEEIIADPIERARSLSYVPHPRIPQPRDLYGGDRVNAKGVDLSDRARLEALAAEMKEAAVRRQTAAPIVGGREDGRTAQPVTSPSDHRVVVGEVTDATAEDVERALAGAAAAAPAWAGTGVEERAACLERAADLMEAEMPTLMAICVREAGKNLADAVAEVREAVDFCRYYALQARQKLGRPTRLRVPSGERREMTQGGKGIFVCISPWNFPLAIFTGQVSAALVAGNAVIAKPAEQTPLIAAHAVRLLHRAGVPAEVLHLLPGEGGAVGGRLVADPRVAGVCFTGSTEVAQLINRTLAGRDAPIATLIAETGGQNAMIVDSTALPEQVVNDVLISAFQSAGQRCSALRVLFVQQDVAPKVLDMLAGAMDELVVGNPALISTDVGPVIDEEARSMLEGHTKRMLGEGRLIKRVKPGPGTEHGTFFGPAAFEIDGLERLQREVFGPILHVVRYPADRLDQVIEAINATGYGLTFGIHTRIDRTASHLFERVRAGNAYVNRNQIGAIVGVQPFGGHGLSGTGPKAGGPSYVPRFAAERVVGEDAAAAEEADQDGAELAAIGLSRASIDDALARADAARSVWARTPARERAAALERAGGLLEQRVAELGKLGAADEEVALAADYLRFFAGQARAELAVPLRLPGPTGERNELSYRGRGLFACLAVAGTRLGALASQVAAALAAGNTVVVWHGQSGLAERMARLLGEAGVPADAARALVSGRDASLEDLLLDPRLGGVALAGPDALARAVNRYLAGREGAIQPLVVHARSAGDRVASPLPGGPNYLHRFVTEHSQSIDTTAAGGNASLLSLGEELPA